MLHRDVEFFYWLFMNKFFLLSIVTISSTIFHFDSQALPISAESNDLVSDGPYIAVKGEQYQIDWLCLGQHKSKNTSIKSAINFKHCGLTAKVEQQKQRVNQLEYQGDFNVAALSDFHGQYDLMLTLLKNNKIIDQEGNWSFADGHFVITGDIFDRGDKVTEILWFIYHLEHQAQKAGGKIHLLLGNHEVMVLNGDLRYLHAKYNLTATLLKTPFEQLFNNETILGSWLRSKPVLVKVNDMLFAHGGFHPSLAKEKRKLTEINTVFKEHLIKAELKQPRTGWAEYLHRTNGPIWYRGYFKDNGANSAEIDLLLNHFDVDHLVVGHTSQKQVETRYQGRVIAIDSSIKKGKYGEILLVEGKAMWRGTLSGKRIPLKI